VNLAAGGGLGRLKRAPYVAATVSTVALAQRSGKCLDVSGASTADGAVVIQWTCGGGTNQMFTLKPVTALGNSKDYQLAAVHSGKCVDVSGISTEPRAKIHQWTCAPATDLTWKKNQSRGLQGMG
jgi:hypothetical protein